MVRPPAGALLRRSAKNCLLSGSRRISVTKKVVIHKPEKVDGKRFQQVDIYYNGVGIIREPSPEEMEEYFQGHLKHKAAKATKTA
jgi:predicted DNA-binding protein (UPF0251 family)